MLVLTSEDVPGRGQSSSGTQPLKGSELTIQLGLRYVTISHHETGSIYVRRYLRSVSVTIGILECDGEGLPG